MASYLFSMLGNAGSSGTRESVQISRQMLETVLAREAAWQPGCSLSVREQELSSSLGNYYTLFEEGFST